MTLDEVVAALREALHLLEEAERGSTDALAAVQDAGGKNHDLELLDDLLHEAAHQNALELAHTVHDIEILARRLELRRRFAHLGDLDRIVAEGFSLPLVDEIARERAVPEADRGALATAVQELCAEWAALPRLGGVHE